MDKKNILIVIIVFLLSCLLLVIGSNPNTLSAKILGLESKIESPRQLYNVYLAGKSIGIIESKEALENYIDENRIRAVTNAVKRRIQQLEQFICERRVEPSMHGNVSTEDDVSENIAEDYSPKMEL